jgi:hypothetical protein
MQRQLYVYQLSLPRHSPHPPPPELETGEIKGKILGGARTRPTPAYMQNKPYRPTNSLALLIVIPKYCQ